MSAEEPYVRALDEPIEDYIHSRPRGNPRRAIGDVEDGATILEAANRWLADTHDVEAIVLTEWREYRKFVSFPLLKSLIRGQGRPEPIDADSPQSKGEK